MKGHRSADIEVTLDVRRCPLRWPRRAAFSSSSPRPSFRFRASYAAKQDVVVEEFLLNTGNDPVVRI